MMKMDYSLEKIMPQKTVFYVFLLIFFTLPTFAQQDGQLLNKTHIADFAALEDYIKQTEQRDSLGLHAERYEHMANVNLYGITYSSDGLKVKGFLLTPKGEGPFPAILYNRGGSLEWGSLTHWVSREAVQRDDALNYDEPWGWMQPARHALGALLMEQNRIDEAVAVYQKDLKKHPKNVWALQGLAECLERQGKAKEAKQYKDQLAAAAARTDVKVDRSCFCRTDVD